MKVVLFSHSLLSDWNHGNAHFLRGVVAELVSRGHDVAAWEDRDAWSVTNLIAERGEGAIECARLADPILDRVVHRYRPERLDLEEALDGASLVIVHEWNDPALVRRIGEHRARARSYELLFHDTHHRTATDPRAMGAFDLRDYDGVLAFGGVVRERYLRAGWTQRAWTWHEAADMRLCVAIDRRASREYAGDVVWIGNWGDEERSAELIEFLVAPVRDLALRARVYGVRYPDMALRALARSGIEFSGWLPNHDVAATYARFAATIHVPRRPYARALPGIPTIRMFEALACGMPLISAPWDDAESLFTRNEDYLVAADGAQMRRQLRSVLHEPALAASLSEHGRRTVLARHTCAHRVDELLAIVAELSERRSGARSIPQPLSA